MSTCSLYHVMIQGWKYLKVVMLATILTRLIKHFHAIRNMNVVIVLTQMQF
jgi:hypothetical protein